MNSNNLILAILLSLQTGCATFTDHKPQLAETQSEAEVRTEKVLSVTVNQKISMNGEVRPPNPKNEEKARDLALDILKERHFFKDVVPSGEASDLRLILTIENVGEGNRVLAFISGFTLFLIPAHAVDDLTLKFQFLDNKDKPLKAYQRRVTLSTWFHLIMLPIMPFKFPFYTHKKEIARATFSVLMEARKDGVFQ